MLKSIAAACLLSLATLPALAADEFRSEYRLDMSETEFRKANEQYFGDGLRLVDITVAPTKHGPRIGAIWQRYPGMPAGSPERTKGQLDRVFLKMDEAGLRELGQRLGPQGSVVEVMDAWVDGGKTWFAASFAPPGETVMQAVGAFLGTEHLLGMREEARKAENDFLRIDAYGEAGQMKSLPAFVKRGASEIEAKTFDTPIAVSAGNAGMYLMDFQPLSISRFQIGEDVKFLATWDKGPRRKFILGDRGEEIRAAVAAGGVVVDLDSDSSASSGEYPFYYAVVQQAR